MVKAPARHHKILSTAFARAKSYVRLVNHRFDLYGNIYTLKPQSFSPCVMYNGMSDTPSPVCFLPLLGSSYLYCPRNVSPSKWLVICVKHNRVAIFMLNIQWSIGLLIRADTLYVVSDGRRLVHPLSITPPHESQSAPAHSIVSLGSSEVSVALLK